jgi:hypothetical protein
VVPRARFWKPFYPTKTKTTLVPFTRFETKYWIRVNRGEHSTDGQYLTVKPILFIS